MLNRRELIQTAAAGAAAPFVTTSLASAQAWPSRFVRLVVPFTPGGGIDAVARIVAVRLSERWGQQVVVDNKPGAGGNIASELVARAEPDGHTLYITAGGLVVNQFLYASINYDPAKDFAPVSLICLFPNLLVVPKNSPFNSVGDLMAHARANPGKVNYGSPGYGSSPHMSGELFKAMTRLDIAHVPYRGAAPALNDVIAGRIEATFAVMASGLPLVQSGQLKALGVTTAKRVDAAPEVPSIAEAGVPGYDTSSWFAFVVPAKTPPAVIRKMYEDTAATLAEPPIKERLTKLGVIVVGSTPEDLGSHLKSETEKWGPVIKSAGIKVNE